MVKIYSRPTCAPCATLKYWLNKKNVAYEEINIDSSGTGYMVAPTIVIGEHIISGLNLGRIAEILGL